MKKSFWLLGILGIMACAMLIPEKAQAVYWSMHYIHPGIDCHMLCQTNGSTKWYFYEDGLEVIPNTGGGACTEEIVCPIDIPAGKKIKRVTPYFDRLYSCSGAGGVDLRQNGSLVDYMTFYSDLTGSSYLAPGTGEDWIQSSVYPYMLMLTWYSSSGCVGTFEKIIVHYE